MPGTYNPPASDTSGKPNSLRISTGYGFKEIPQTTVTMSDKKDLDNGGKYVEYTVNNIPSNTLGAQGGVANIKLRPKAAIKDGLLYVFLTTEDSSIAIDQRKLKNTTTARGYYLDALKINITADQNLEVDKHGPENVNASGSITDMKQFDVGLSKDGPSVNYSFGSQTTRNFNDFGFTDFKINNMVEGYWHLTPDIVVKTAGQFSSLNAPPVLASSNFPIYEQVIFKAKDSNYLPDKVTLNVQLRPMFKKQILINNQSSDVQAFFEGFGVLFNPKTYSGELVYRLGVDSLANELIYSITLDLTPLKR